MVSAFLLFCHNPATRSCHLKSRLRVRETMKGATVCRLCYSQPPLELIIWQAPFFYCNTPAKHFYRGVWVLGEGSPENLCRRRHYVTLPLLVVGSPGLMYFVACVCTGGTHPPAPRGLLYPSNRFYFASAALWTYQVRDACHSRRKEKVVYI